MLVVLFNTNVSLSKLLLLYIFMLLYIAFVILFGVRLNAWDDENPGRCYHTENLSNENAAHPFVDIIYLVITSLYLFVSLEKASRTAISKIDEMILEAYIDDTSEGLSQGWNRLLSFLRKFLTVTRGSSLLEGIVRLDKKLQERLLRFYSSVLNDQVTAILTTLVQLPPHTYTLSALLDKTLPERLKRFFSSVLEDQIIVLLTALVQLPLHAYTLFALRASNEKYLSGESENTWGFGQVVALVLLGAVILEGIRCVAGKLELVALRLA
jgi:hypothetical protein